MKCRIDAGFHALVPTQTDEEIAKLYESLDKEGCRDSLKVWTDENGDGVPVLLDGMTRYPYCVERGTTYTLYEVPGIARREDAKLWIIDATLGRRNLTDYQKGVLARKAKAILTAQAKARQMRQPKSVRANLPPQKDKGKVRDQLAKKAGVSSGTMEKINTIEDAGTPEIKEATAKGEKSIDRAYKEVVADLQAQAKARYQNGESIREIAKTLGKGFGTVQKWLVGTAKGLPDTTKDNGEDQRQPPSFIDENEEEGEVEVSADERTDTWANWNKSLQSIILICQDIGKKGGITELTRAWPEHEKARYIANIKALIAALSHHLEESVNNGNVIDIGE